MSFVCFVGFMNLAAMAVATLDLVYLHALGLVTVGLATMSVVDLPAVGLLVYV